MSEPEELILEGAHFATRVARDLWRRHAPAPKSSSVALANMRARLELFVSALFATSVQIRAMEPPATVTWLSRLASGGSRDRGQPALCGTDGDRVYLPPVLEIHRSNEHTIAMYQMLAVGQSARMVRRSVHVVAGLRTQQARDWFKLADAAVVDRWIALNAPGLVDVLVDARSVALRQRHSASLPHEIDPVERAVSGLLRSAPRSRILDVPEDASAEACAAWAEHLAGRSPGRAHRQTARVAYWGELLEPSHVTATVSSAGIRDDRAERGWRPRTIEMRRGPRPREAADGEDDARPGAWIIRADDPQESVEDPFGLQRPIDRQHDAHPDGLGDSLSELPEARVVRTPDAPREVLRAGERPTRTERILSNAVEAHSAISYPEWDYRTNQYREPGAIVRELEPKLGDATWAECGMSRHGGLVRRVRTRFERLRPQRVRFFRQVDGTDVDIAAFVSAAADRQAGVASDGRLYVASRAERRELAVALLLDVSASTDAWVSANRRIVDVEKDAMLVVCEALDALGDRFALFAFSGEGADHVDVLRLKGFEERPSTRIRRRIAALDSDGYTRLGGAIRHVTAALSRERAASRLLLLLSDGKPNDIDAYESSYGVEDTRQAVVEARLQGIAVFCLTVDRDAPRYASRIFGRSGFAVLHRPEQLPAVVVEVLRNLIKS